MIKQLFANNASTTLKQRLASTANELVVVQGTGSLFPNPDTTQGEFFLVTLEDPANKKFEIVKVIKRINDTFYIIRGQENTIAKEFNPGTIVELRITKETLENLRNIAVSGGNIYIHIQNLPSTIWKIFHNMNTYPSVNIFDDDGNVIITNFKYLDTNSIEIYFSSPITGKVYLT